MVKTQPSMFHTNECHNFWIDRNKFCPYCNSGSRPVPKAAIDEHGELIK